MGKIDFKPGNMLYPLPAVLVSVADKKGNSNIFTVAWAGTVCSDPPMVSISVRPERYSYGMLCETGEFIINLTTEALAYATDFCGVTSGRDIDKWEKLGLTKLPGNEVAVPRIAESPVSIECVVKQQIPLGTHDMFVAQVVSVSVDDAYMDEKNFFHLEEAKPLVYSHGTYFSVGKPLGKFGYSIQKDRKKT
jgi:flavin reductase (DIM6/NTAB) family NADH-FMN oxidoreductase RutF